MPATTTTPSPSRCVGLHNFTQGDRAQLRGTNAMSVPFSPTTLHIDLHVTCASGSAQTRALHAHGTCKRTMGLPCVALTSHVITHVSMQERIKISDKDMDYYKDLAEMYVGDDVSPDFYGWVFPKYDHVAVGTGTVVNKSAIKQYQQATRDRSEAKTRGGKIIRVEAHPIPEHPRPKRVQVRAALSKPAALRIIPRSLDVLHHRLSPVQTSGKCQV